MQAVGFDGDVRKQEDADRVLAATVAHFGKLDILVNGAAGNFLASPEDLTPKGFRTGTSSKCALVFHSDQWSSLLPIVSNTLSLWFGRLRLPLDQQLHAYARSKTCLFYFAYYYAFSEKFELTKFLSAVLEIDTLGTYTMCYEALKYLKKGGPGKGPSTGGLIINISATLHYTASWYQIHVSAAKVPGSLL
jgi:NAD(P)-dependent dehydrogenase (short-subunit alcohol dehydrogenase family)